MVTELVQLLKISCVCNGPYVMNKFTYLPTYYVALVRKRTIPTERPLLVGEVSANFCG
jgi:hypothetical protein